MSVALFSAGWALLIAVIVVWHHRVLKPLRKPRQAPPSRSRWDLGRIVDRHPWIVWLTAIALLAAWLAHNSVTAETESQSAVYTSRST
jgi:hypothetical protein